MTVRRCRGMNVTYINSIASNSPSYHSVYRVTDLKSRKILGDYYCDWDAVEEAVEYARIYLDNNLRMISIRQIY